MSYDPGGHERDLLQKEALRKRVAQHGGQKQAGDEVDLSDGLELLAKRIIKPGNRELVPMNSIVFVEYVGMFEDKRVFDSSARAGRPFSFRLGRQEVIPGWDVGVASMQRGEKCVLKCTPGYAYGRNGSGGTIPPNTTLYFEVELLGWRELPPEPVNYAFYAVVLLIIAAILTYVLWPEGDAAAAAGKGLTELH
ncbi:FKBP-type peptidyl-prolyl cis-trans isomerase 3 [Tribonema minus]|uniref:peptidylprolyl isomerase n=1 Tax=Tribonema minus TaxID=303371 RepID=A0A835Z8L2_9STRA|nr:FKBP-type peptidyl-prolyl cis-trans isomerase 3 [Tribonema minus]